MKVQQNLISMDEKLTALAKKLKDQGKKETAKGRRAKKENPPPSVIKAKDLRKEIALVNPETRLPVDSPEMKRFFDLLSDGGMVTEACKTMGWNVDRIFNRSARDKEFRVLYKRARRIGVTHLEDEAVRRAYRGVKTPKNMGKHGIVEVTEYSDSLLKFVLQASRPSKYREPKVVQDNRQMNIVPFDQMIQDLREIVDGQTG